MIRRLLIYIAFVFAVTASAVASDLAFDNEELSFRVTYKWGLIHKVAGSAGIKLTREADGYHAMLTARTQPWADRIFMVRDTLSGIMRLGDMSPLLYDKSTHEDRQYRHDIIHYSYHGNRAIANVERFKRDRKGKIETADTTMSALLPAVDMLSVYYFVRRLPFENMKPRTVSRANIFSGKKIEKLSITYDGDERIELNGKKYDCYRIHFMFSSERIKNSSKPMKAWIVKTGSRIPIKLEGELPIGKIQILYNEPTK
ncbi:MAG: DUF3108 domain-containing protein [Muribaculaceae bacterium]|nr:DUF3108 domain-containing protein [Muribaculaceae bacterium]MDE7111798.1 DUF3108 domain-containing protein [Muribaculaceae bacterium]